MMETTLLLSTACLDDTDRILSVQDMVPEQLQEHYCPPAPACFAREANQDRHARHEVRSAAANALWRGIKQQVPEQRIKA